MLIFLLASPAAEYFHDPRVGPVMAMLALSPLLAGLENIGIVSFQKQMEFGKEFRFFFIKRIAGFVVTVTAALILRDYWALVIGTLSGRLTGVLVSYTMHPMRPGMNVAGIRKILSFSTWNLLRGIAGALNDSLHRVIVGRRANSAVMGEYALANEIAALPSTELLAPLGRVLFPAFVNIKDDPARLREAFLLALGVQALVGIPAGAGIALVADELVLALLGEKWIAAVPFIQIMGAINIIAALNSSSCYVLLAMGKPRAITINGWLQVVLFIAGAYLLIPQQGAFGIAVLRLAVVVFGLGSFIYLVKQELPALDAWSLIETVWRPGAAAMLMGIVLFALPLPADIPVMIRLLSKIATGMLAFAFFIIALWVAIGRPQGAESYLLNKICFWLRIAPRQA